MPYTVALRMCYGVAPRAGVGMRTCSVYRDESGQYAGGA
jgi:hypothetical protein